MKVVLKKKIKFGKTTLDKGSTGRLIAVSNSAYMKKEFPCFVDDDGFYYIVEFVGFPECLIDKSKVDIVS